MTPCSPEASFAGRRVMVTGGTGFVGRHLVEQLQATGATVVIPVHRRQLPRDIVNVDTIAADLTREEDALRATAGIDDVLHAAGSSAGAGASPLQTLSGMTTNLILTARVLEAAARNGVSRCLVFSSSTVYPELDRAAREEDAWSGPPHPAYAGYGWMRRYFELLSALVTQQTSMRVTVVRPTAVYGRHDNFDPHTSHFVPALIRRAVARENPFEVWGTGDETRDLLHVRDLARGCLLAMSAGITAEPINIGAGAPVAMRDVVRVILDAARFAEADVRFNPSRPVTIGRRAIDCTRARQILGFTPAVPLEEGLRDTIDWYRAHSNMSDRSR